MFIRSTDINNLGKPRLLVSVFVDAVVDPLAVVVQVLDTPSALLAMPNVFLHDGIAQRAEVVEFSSKLNFQAGLHSATSCFGSTLS
jgi:hypothetical protein